MDLNSINQIEAYLLLFADSFLAALILPLHSEMIFKVMATFGTYNKYLIFLIASTASIGGSYLSWLVGNKIASIKKLEILKKSQLQIKNIEGKWNRYVVWLLLLASIKTVGNPLCLLSGFFATNIKKFTALVGAGKFTYYFYLIFLL